MVKLVWRLSQVFMEKSAYYGDEIFFHCTVNLFYFICANLHVTVLRQLVRYS